MNKLLLSLTAIIALFLGCGQSSNPQAIKKTAQPEEVAAIPIAYCSKDGGSTWLPFSEGLPATATVNGFALTSDTAWAATNSHGVYLKIGDGAWVQHGILPQGVKVSAITKTKDRLLIGTFAHGIMRMENGTGTWQNARTDFSKTPVRALMAHGGKIFAATNAGVYSSGDGGQNWAHAFGDFQCNGFAAEGNKVYLAAMNGAYLSENGGVAWRKIYAPHTLHDIAVDRQRVFAMTLGAALLSSDNDGKTWASASAGLELGRYTFEVKKMGNSLFLGHWTGIFRSENGGQNWLPVEGGLPAGTAFPVLETSETLIVAAIGLRG